MKMPKSIQEVHNARRNANAPEALRSKEYKQLEKGDEVVVTAITVNVYQPRDKVSGEWLFREDDTPVLNRVAYLELEDGQYTSVNGLDAVAQIMSMYEEPIPEAVGSYPLEDMSVIKLKCTTVPQKYGNGKEYPKIAFEI